MRRIEDLEPVRRLLLEREPATRSIYNAVFGCAGERAAWVRVDDPADPRAVICRSRALLLWARNRAAGRRLLDSIPRHWRPQFRATPSWACDHLARTRRILWTTPCFGYSLVDPARLPAEPGHRVGRLTPDDTAAVTALWPYARSRRASPLIRRLIERWPSAAIRRDGRLVGWSLLHADGSMGFLHVLKEYRHRGFARALGIALARRVLACGLRPFVFIETGNRPSLRLTAGLGFERVGRYTWFGAGPRTRRRSGPPRAARAAR
ncbi:GNAT family N-acetyltransferase [candidate division WOR-3 bacterium]|nr:GNAT family N-acetyltransferase [candidate division WOR-3 bacterium]